ncbi:MAG: DNA-directed DNA polymerase [Burkholderiaceae bacterium]
MLRTLFVDFNSYFASVEQQLNPKLRGRPVGVVPMLAETTCCIAASFEAKQFGVKTGTGVREARQLCPDIVLVEAQHEKYVRMHQRAVAAVDRIAPVRQVLSIDEMECELTGRWRARDKAVAIAHAVKKEITGSLGVCMTTSIGIAPNTLLGKLASDMKKPDGLTIIELADLPHGLYHLKLQDIVGIGPRMLLRLNRCGIHSIEQLYAAPRDVLHTVWGGVAGSEMHDMLRGQWYGPRVTTARSLSHAHVMPPGMRHPQGAFDVLNRLTQKAAMRLRKQGYFAAAMSVGVRADHRYKDSLGGSRDTRFAQTQDTAYLLHVLHLLWHSGLQEIAHPKAVSVTLHGLVLASQHTPDLFDAPTAAPFATSAAAPLQAAVNTPPLRDRSKLHAAVDQMNIAYGKNKVYFATAHHALDHAPMRIAFNRIPDLDTER